MYSKTMWNRKFFPLELIDVPVIVVVEDPASCQWKQQS
jgi:hypothetical protein